LTYIRTWVRNGDPMWIGVAGQLGPRRRGQSRMIRFFSLLIFWAKNPRGGPVQARFSVAHRGLLPKINGDFWHALQ
jgi:hypothetical protein